ncbi:ankyrin, partial [Piromyces finnis]
MLVKAGAKINKYYYFVELPIAARNGNFELVKFLLKTYRKQQGYDKKLSVNTLKMKLKWNNYCYKNYQPHEQQYFSQLDHQSQESQQESLINRNQSTLYQYQKQQKQIYMYGNCLYAAMYALTNGHREIYEYLMDYSDFYSKDNSIYKVPMVIALSENNLKVLEYLSMKGIPLNQSFNFKVSLSDSFVKNLSKFCDVQYNEEPLISLENTSLLHYSVYKREYAIVQYLINNGVDINYQCEKGYTALMIATKNNDIRMVNLLVANGAKVNIKDKEQMCPLLIACINGFVVLVKYFIDSGGDINVKSKFGENMLHLSYQLAIGNEHFIMEKYNRIYFNLKGVRSQRSSFEHMVNYLLVHKIDITVRDINLISTVDYAVVNNRVSDAKYFLINGANPNCQYNELDLLKYVILKNWLNMVRLLINFGADIERKDKHFNTPLSCAVRAGSIDILKELVQAGVNLKSRDENGYTPLIYAVKRNSLVMINYLISKGVDINEKDNEGCDALLHAISAPNNSIDVIQCLIDHGADINSKSNHLIAPILLAAKNNDYTIVRYLANKGADINTKDITGYNSLMFAILNHNIPMMKFLIENNISINDRNHQDYTALMIASENGYINIV